MADGYIAALPEPNDPNDLAAAAFAYMKANVPGWDPSGDAVVETWLMTALAFMVATLMDLAGTVGDNIMRYFGESLLARHLPYLAPINPTPASTTTTWTALDTLGYTIPAGTTIGFQTAGDSLTAFTVDATVTIPAGTATLAGVAVTAVTAGSAANALTSPVVMVDDLAWVTTVTADAPPSGGTDGETDSAYLDRLSVQLELLAPRAILPGDFAAFALNVAGVGKSMAIDGYKPARAVTDAATSTSNASLTSATAAFTTDDVGSTVTGTGIAASTTITAYVSPTQVTMSHNGTATASGEAVTIGAMSGLERACTVAVADVNGAALSPTVKAAVLSLLRSQREVSFLPFVIDPTYTTVNVAFTATAKPGHDPSTVSADCVAAISSFLNPANWGGVDTAWPAIVELFDVSGVIYGVDGVETITALTLNGGSTPVTLTGIAPLPQVGTITPLVT